MANKPVVVGVDGSRASARAAAVAGRIADAAREECLLVHVVRDTWLADDVGPLLLGSRALLDEAVENARARVTEGLSDAAPASVLGRLDVRVGRPAVALRLAADEANAQYVVIGGKHHTAVGRVITGSTARDLVRTMDRPLLVVGEREEPLRRVLVAVDLSPASRPALAAARRLARLCDAELRVLHVVEPVRAPLTLPFAIDEADVARRAETAFTRLERGAAGAPRGEWVARRGVALDTLAEEARTWAADVVVVGSHGKGWVDRVLVGSTTERLLALLPTSVLVVPTGRRAARGPSGTLPRKARATPRIKRKTRGVAA
jgi:nucleotide-binding universal stress UspA family protein